MSVPGAKTRRPRVSAADAMTLAKPTEPVGPLEAPSAADGMRASVYFTLLFESPLNPRTRHDEAAEQSLADNIAAQGLIEPLVVRQVAAEKFAGGAPDGAVVYEIVAGARRKRAIGRLVADGRWPADRPIDVIIRELTDKQHLEHALSENLQRADMDPLDEAEGYRKLRELGDEPAAIAKNLCIVERQIWRRLRLLKLEAKWHEQLRDGDVTLQEADAVADAEPQLQRLILEDILADPQDRSRRHPATLRARVTYGLPRVEWAVFERERYEGPLLRNDEDEQDAGCFGDVEQFKRLQEEAIGDLTQKMAAEGGWAFVERVGADWHRHWQFGGDTRDAKAGLLVEVTPDLARVTLRENYVPIPAPAPLGDAAEGEPAAEPSEISSGRYVSRAQLGTVRAAKTRSLQEEVARYSHLAQSLVCLALLGGPEIMIRRFYHPERQDELLAQQIQDSLPAGFAPFDGFMVRAEDSDKAARNLKLLMAEDAALVEELLARLVARDVGCWHNANPELGDTPLACTIAKMVDLDRTELAIDEPYLKGYDMDGLRRLASAAELDPFPAATKKADMVAQLLDHNARADRPLAEVAPEARFASRTAMTDAFAGLVAARGAPKPIAPSGAAVPADETESERPPDGARGAAAAAGKGEAAASPPVPKRRRARAAARLAAEQDAPAAGNCLYIVRMRLPSDPPDSWRVRGEFAAHAHGAARALLATDITIDRRAGAIAGTEWQLARETEAADGDNPIEILAHSRLDKKGKGLSLTIITADLDLEVAARAEAGTVSGPVEDSQ